MGKVGLIDSGTDRKFENLLFLGEKGNLSIDDGFNGFQGNDWGEYRSGQWFGNDGAGIDFVIHANFDYVNATIELYMMNKEKQPAESKAIIEYLINIVGCQPKSNQEIKYPGSYSPFYGCMAKMYFWQD